MKIIISILHIYQSKKDEELTFVAIGNRSQAKEEEGEKIHSVHLREERKENRGGEVTGWGEEREGGIQFMHQQLISREDSTVTRQKQIKQNRDAAQRVLFSSQCLCKENHQINKVPWM